MQTNREIMNMKKALQNTVQYVAASLVLCGVSISAQAQSHLFCKGAPAALAVYGDASDSGSLYLRLKGGAGVNWRLCSVDPESKILPNTSAKTCEAWQSIIQTAIATGKNIQVTWFYGSDPSIAGNNCNTIGGTTGHFPPTPQQVAIQD